MSTPRIPYQEYLNDIILAQFQEVEDITQAKNFDLFLLKACSLGQTLLDNSISLQSEDLLNFVKRFSTLRCDDLQTLHWQKRHGSTVSDEPLMTFRKMVDTVKANLRARQFKDITPSVTANMDKFIREASKGENLDQSALSTQFSIKFLQLVSESLQNGNPKTSIAQLVLNTASEFSQQPPRSTGPANSSMVAGDTSGNSRYGNTGRRSGPLPTPNPPVSQRRRRQDLPATNEAGSWYPSVQNDPYPTPGPSTFSARNSVDSRPTQNTFRASSVPFGSTLRDSMANGPTPWRKADDHY